MPRKIRGKEEERRGPGGKKEVQGGPAYGQ